MDQPLDLSTSNNKTINKKFTIEYLISDFSHQCRSSLLTENQIFLPYLNSSIPPLHPVENHLNHHNKHCWINSRLNEHIVPNTCSPSLTVFTDETKRVLTI